ncbi:hypothetical protein RFI_21135, partial [Reticulomyxa filosa]
ENKTQRGLVVEDVVRKRVNTMNHVYTTLKQLETRTMAVGSKEYLRGLVEVRELQLIMSNHFLKYFFTTFVTRVSQAFHDLQLVSISVDDLHVLDLNGIQTLTQVLKRNKNDSNLAQNIQEIAQFLDALPDSDIVIMQVARQLTLATPYKEFIIGKSRPQTMLSSLTAHNTDQSNSFVILDLFITKLLEEWIGSICNIYGHSGSTNVRIALEDDVMAQVRPDHAANLIVSCVWGVNNTF